MLIQRIKYFLEMPWKVILADAQKYNAMRKEYFALRKKARLAHKDLINDLGEVVDFGTPSANGCIINWVRCYTIPSSREIIPRFYYRICECFNETMPCDKKNCQYYKKNQEFFAALEAMNNFKVLKDEYWKRNLFIAK
ncbi:MAG TPA: hypothetical protein IAC63_03570 [Candidatus Enterousia avicola]|uniref:Uncharacterized protein n=1 Tax=Candidatus Enterousia avicola TaxID=2840787 RepID=A0A9D1SMA4_9PROT|nr:hypothetical protein [Candidatus Enterousia avicola]